MVEGSGILRRNFLYFIRSKMGRFLTLTKVQFFCTIFSSLGILYIITILSQLKVQGFKPDSTNKIHERSLPVQNKPVYWLSAAHADSGYMNHVKETFKRIGFERWDGRSGDWDVMWSYEYPFGTTIKSSTLKQHQRINHFPGSGYLTSKGFLAMSTSRYIPLAFSLPKNETHFKKYVQEHPDKMWVQKSNKHRGIKIKSWKELDYFTHESFIQEFVRKPFLVDGRKFDIGIYTVITSIQPLIVYVLDTEWLIRYCPEDYEPFDPRNPRKYVVEDDYTPTWEMPSLKEGYKSSKLSHKTSLLRYIKQKGHDSAKVKNELYEAVAELVWEKQKNIIASVANYPFGTKSFFELVRFDFVLDENMKVYVMEVNMSPNLSSGHFGDNARMYRQVVYNTLSLVGISSKTDHLTTSNRLAEEMAASDYDIVAYPDECALCNDCRTEICSVCFECLTIDQKNMLKEINRQFVEKRNFKRVYPKPLGDRKSAQAFDSSRSKFNTVSDKLVALWFKGKCMYDDAWCQ